MLTYQDQFGLYHDKPVGDNQMPTSNNGWIYSAYAKKLGLYFPIFSTFELYQKCIKFQNPLIIERLPWLEEPPISHDEIVGMVSLGYMKNSLLEENYYQYYCPDGRAKPWYKLNYLKIIKALWYLKGKHRTTVWKEEVKDAYPVAFRLSAANVYYVRKMKGLDVSPYQWFMFWASAFVTTFFGDGSHGDYSAKNIMWLQLNDLGYDKTLIGKAMNKTQKWNFLMYFGEDHIFNNGN